MLRGSAFDTNRFNGTNPTDKFDPITEVDVTEDLLNILLVNITISALSLGTWQDIVPVTTTRYRNTYQFSHPINLVLPYSICLGIAIAFAMIAIWSLHQNGVPAADGGFLQVMMATRGDTDMERLVLKEGVVAIDKVSEDLKNLRIRYGELGIAEKRLGFGTVDETLPNCSTT